MCDEDGSLQTRLKVYGDAELNNEVSIGCTLIGKINQPLLDEVS